MVTCHTYCFLSTSRIHISLHTTTIVHGDVNDNDKDGILSTLSTLSHSSLDEDVDVADYLSPSPSFARHLQFRSGSAEADASRVIVRR